MNNEIYMPGECTRTLLSARLALSALTNSSCSRSCKFPKSKKLTELKKLYMNVEIHPVLLQEWYCADVLREVSSIGARVVPASDLFEPAVVVWSRTLDPELINDTGQMHMASEQCDRAIYVQCAEETASQVRARTWSQHVKQIRDVVGRRMTVAVFGAKDYFIKSRRRTNNSHFNLMNEMELEMAIPDLIVTADCDVVKVNTPYELALLISQFTKAIAEAPYIRAKRAFDEQAEFNIRDDMKKPGDKEIMIIHQRECNGFSDSDSDSVVA